MIWNEIYVEKVGVDLIVEKMIMYKSAEYICVTASNLPAIIWTHKQKCEIVTVFQVLVFCLTLYYSLSF